MIFSEDLLCAKHCTHHSANYPFAPSLEPYTSVYREPWLGYADLPLILLTALRWGCDCGYPCFIDGETEQQEGSSFSQQHPASKRPGLKVCDSKARKCNRPTQCSPGATRARRGPRGKSEAEGSRSPRSGAGPQTRSPHVLRCLQNGRSNRARKASHPLS